MSSGSWLGMGEGAIGELPNDMGPWEKLQLGWLDYEVARAATRSTHRLGASALTYPETSAAGGRDRGSQALIVELPAKSVSDPVHEPAQGEWQWWSGSGDDLSNTLARTVDLTGATTASLDLTAWWSTEEGFDHVYVEASADGGATWTALDGTADGQPLGEDSAGRTALSGESMGDVTLSFPLDAYAGAPVDLRFRYQTDGSVAYTGFTADEITVTADGATVFADDAESGAGDWEADGFSVVGASISGEYPQYYLVENRQYVGFDRTLRYGPYNFGFTDSRPDWVEHFPYQNGMLVWLWDTSQQDNDVSAHPGEGLILPVDAHAGVDRWSDGTVIRNRIQTRDATFSHHPTRRLTLHRNSVPTTLPSQPGAPAFDDRRGTYWDEANPGNSVIVPDTNTRISIVSQPLDTRRPITVQVAPSRR
jgi:immune inhibitor A